MIPFDRHQEILELLEKHHSMTVKRLAELLHTSEPTLRRDLVTLEKQGYVNRVFGGVVLSRYANNHLPLSARQQSNKLAKADVAAKAAQCIPDGSVILMDGSSTCQICFQRLAPSTRAASQSTLSMAERMYMVRKYLPLPIR